jgi:M3 family oligoendopeptidase
MPTFKEYNYHRPDIDQLRQEWQELIAKFDRATVAQTQIAIITEINQLRNDFETMASLVQIRHNSNTADPDYGRENDYLDEVQPIYEGLVNRYYRSLVNSPHRQSLEASLGKRLFRLAELKLQTFTPAVTAKLQTENKLTSRYTKLRAAARIKFHDKVCNLAQMGSFLEAPDRTLRQAAQEAVTGFFQENEAEFDAIYDQLVNLRTDIAHQLGFASFTPLGYARLGRSDYNPAMVAAYRRQIRENIVPLATQLRRKQAARLHLPILKYYDEPLKYPAGNPLPKGNLTELISNGLQMYQELAPETDRFFQFMVDQELFDLDARQGKAGGGFCTYINNYLSPFIFANCNGTLGDIDVLTHEAGHAFQVYSSRNYSLPEYIWPTLEACEIHSMSMEFFTWPWMKLFFSKPEQYHFVHLSEAVLFLPYGATVDEFQHWVYAHPEATPAERKKYWRALEQQYLPHRDYAQNDLLERGGYWLRQGHIFNDPYYYIDYTLAQVCAFQFWIKCRRDQPAAWQDYLRLCKAGGSQSFLELVRLANLKNPFDAGCLYSLIGPIKQWLDENSP